MHNKRMISGLGCYLFTVFFQACVTQTTAGSRLA